MLSANKHKTRKRYRQYLEPDAAPYVRVPRSTAHRLNFVSTPTPTSCASSSASSPCSTTQPRQPLVEMEDCTSDADEHLRTEDESDTAENESPRGSDHDRPFVEFVTPLGNGTSMTVGDALVLIMDYAIGEGLPWTGIEKLLKLQNLLLGTNSIPESKYLFRKFASASPDDVTFNFYCPTCETLLAKTAGSLKERQGISPTCSVCGVQYLGKDLMSKGCYFVGLPMEKQLASVLADETVREHLAESLAKLNTPRPSAKLDLTDGDSYRSQRAKLGCGPHDLTVSMNADGSPIFKSANYAIWPVQLTLNELPPCLRWRSVVLPLLWYGAKHPNMTLLLQAFAAQMKTLAQEGITWSAGGSTLNSKVYCVSCVADAPARAAMQNVMQYNGYYGCSWCLHPGVCINGCVKYPVSAGVMDDRTELGMVADMAEAAASKQAVHGVKGPSPLVNVPGFDIVWGFTPDYMHCALLGVGRQFAELWFSGVGEDYYIGHPSRQSIVTERLCSLKPPQCLNRPPRALRLRKYWKAAEWQCWLFYYCLPCLKGVLPAEYYAHFELFVSALYLLTKTEVLDEDVELGTEKMTEFVVKTEFLYGKAQMTSNVHTLLHLPKAVLLHGPLWALSCFQFESNMGHLLKLVSSSNGVPFQIFSRILLRNSFYQLRNMVSDEVRAHLPTRKHYKPGDLHLLGKPRQLPQCLHRLVEEELALEVAQELVEFDRARVAGHIFHSKQYRAPTKRDSTALKLGDNFVRVEHILSESDGGGSPNVYIVSHVYDVSDFGSVGHLKLAHKQPTKVLHRLCGHVNPCMYLDIDGIVLFAQLCNKYEWS
ncbi:uncharacterized protein LOC120839164 [Ixodes scapularis]|uniref:uncharacterized protein LOC120839164 n=1 Tax=Ixodes scapularis TaxID=6945 RepID=UPI001A9F7CDF|nr:uncharacterized protein LOC120839164 [Ixodes scapularis]